MNNKKYSKGAGTSISSIIMILVMLFLLAVYLNLINNELNKRTKLNLREAEILKLSNTFVLTNRSLGMTWFISTNQAIFNSLDNSLFCGIDDNDIAGEDLLPDKYIYRYKPSNNGQNFRNIDIVKQLSDAEPATEDEAKQIKYAPKEIWPRACYETRLDAKRIIREQFGPYKAIKKEFNVNGISVKIDEIENELDFNPSYGMWSKTNQVLTLVSSSGLAKIDDVKTENINQIYTKLPEMISAINKIVKAIATFSDLLYKSDSSDAIFTQQLQYQQNDNKNSYMYRIKAELQNFVEANVKGAPNGFLGTTQMDFSKTELSAANPEDSQVFGKDKAAVPVGSYGLIFHYDASVRLTDGSSITGLIGKPQPDDYKRIIEESVASWGKWKFTGSLPKLIFKDFEYTNDDLVAFVSAIINHETGGNWNPNAVSDCGAAGLNQFMPRTARTYGLINIFENANFDNCLLPDGSIMPERLEYSKKLRNAINGLDNEAIKSIDDRFDPEKSIPAAVRFLHVLFEEMDDYAADRDELLRLVAAAYNTGIGNVINAIETAVLNNPSIDRSNIKYDEIKNYLPSDETRNYVPKVIGYYVYYGGTLAGNFYYYHDVQNNKFIPRPFSLEVKAEDYLPALICIDELTLQPKPSAEIYGWIGTSDVACCGGVLWSCDKDIDNLAPSQKLSIGSKANNPAGTGPDKTCDNALTTVVPAPGAQTIVQNFDLVCTNNGFVIVLRTQ